MTDKRTIAVVGATGAQGGGLVRAILADPNGGFAARALTRDVNSEKAKELARLGRRGRGRRRRRRREPEAAFARRLRRLLRHLLLGALLAGEGAGPGAGHGRRRRRTAGVKHVIWSTLEDTRKWVPLDDDRMPTLHGQVQGAALRRQGRGRPVLHRPRRADDLPADLVLLGQPHPLRHGPEEGRRTASSPSPCRWATRSCPGSPPRTSAGAPTASSRGARSSSARPSASPAST